MRFYWTGFEPFGSHSYNPSWDVARAAARRVEGSHASRAERLPVEYAAVEEWVETRLKGDVATFVIQVGLAESRDEVSLERCARNEAGERPDVAGERLGGPERPLAPEGEESIETSVPLCALRESLAERLGRIDDAPDVGISDDAGAYVCNALYFRSLRRAPEHVSVLFVHVPEMEPEMAVRVGRELGRGVLEVSETFDDSNGQSAQG